MIVRAWAAVVIFRLSLGKVDRLQDCVRAFHGATSLPPRSSGTALDRELARWSALPSWTEELVRFVPGRFLGPWFPEVARKAPYDRRGAQDVVDAAHSAWGTAESAPYRLVQAAGETFVELAPGWQDWLGAHQALVTGYVEHQLATYLQARNPNVPALISKLALPRRRSLGVARSAWAWVLAQEFGASPCDIYTLLPVGAEYEIDHFLPWSFVAHDEFWNLCPVTPGINRSKADYLPALEPYLERLSDLHASIMTHSALPRGLAITYSEFVGVAPGDLRSIPAEVIAKHYRDIVGPLAQIAANQGFPSNWKASGTPLSSQDFAPKGGDRRAGLLGTSECAAEG